VPIRSAIGTSIPVAMITGTCGKTTTTRMLAHILSESGHDVGYTSTDGVVINGKLISEGDSSGYRGAHAVMSCRSITAAVLETARGGLLHSGLYINRCNVAAMLNVGHEQIGIGGIETLEQMAALKRKVIDAAQDMVVLNADDEQCAALIGQYPASRVILFSMKANNLNVLDHLQKKGVAYVLGNLNTVECLMRKDIESERSVISVMDLASCVNGVFRQNIANALAAASLAEGMKVPMQFVRSALGSFKNSAEHSYGRLNIIDGYSQRILLDKGVSIPSARALMESIGRMKHSGRSVCIVETAGNRASWHYVGLGELLGAHFDQFICFDSETYRRGRAAGEIPGLLKDALVVAGVSSDCVMSVQGYDDAAKALAQVAGQDDLMVILTLDAKKFLDSFQKYFGMPNRMGAQT